MCVRVMHLYSFKSVEHINILRGISDNNDPYFCQENKTFKMTGACDLNLLWPAYITMTVFWTHCDMNVTSSCPHCDLLIIS